MRALHLIQRYGVAGLTGSERAIEILCRSLANKSAIDVSIITSNAVRGEGFYDPRDQAVAVGTSKQDGVTIIRLACNWWLASVFYVLNKVLPFLRPLGGGWLTMMAFGPQLSGLEQAIITAKPDLLHTSPMPLAHMVSSWKIAKKHNIPLVITPTMHFDDDRFSYPLLYRIMSSADAVIAHTNYEKTELVKRGISAEKIDVIHSSFLTPDDFIQTDDAAFRAEYGIGRDPYVLFIGSKSFDKGTIHLLEAWPTVLSAMPNARLVIAGLPTSSWIEGKKGKDMTNVIELDYVSNEQKAMVLSGCSLLCVPSHAESFGMILLEAWAKKKPVIGGSAGATREMVEQGVNGFTVGFGDTKQLAKKIFEILSQPKLARQMGAAGFEKASKFTEIEMIDKTVAIYEKVIKK